MNDQNDSEIIATILAGETALYSVLVNRYRNMAFTLALNILHNREDAEEAAQDAFVKAFTALRSFKAQSRFVTWLYRIVINTALNKRKEKKFNTEDIADQVTGEEYISLNLLFESHKNSEQKRFIQLALDTLREEESICISLFYLEELPVQEIHEITGISQSNIKVLLYRGRKHLYEALNKLLKTEIKNLI